VVVVGIPSANRASISYSDEVVSALNVPEIPDPSSNGDEIQTTTSTTIVPPILDNAVTSSEASMSGQLSDDTPETSGTEDIVRRSSVKVLRGILKKPRRHSREVKMNEVTEIRSRRGHTNGDAGSIDQSIIPEISSQHSDEEQSQSPVKPTESPTNPEPRDTALYKLERGSLQMAAFDRILFAKRGAELRDAYMRDGRNNNDLADRLGLDE
jgi:hypothetical protein